MGHQAARLWRQSHDQSSRRNVVSVTSINLRLRPLVSFGEKYNDFTEFGLPVDNQDFIILGAVGRCMSACCRFARNLFVCSLAFPSIGPPGRPIRYDPESDQMGRGTLVSGD